MSPTVLGIAAGLFLAGLSILGNVRRHEPNLVSTFPDLVTVAVFPVLVLLVILRWRARGLRRDAIGDAARRLTIVSALVFGLLMGAFTLYWLPGRSMGLATYTAGTSFIATLILGFIASVLCARAVARAA